jgi:hypothetical protein
VELSLPLPKLEFPDSMKFPNGTVIILLFDCFVYYFGFAPNEDIVAVP